MRPEALAPTETGLPAEVTHIEPMGREVLTTAQTPLGLVRFLEAGTQPRWQAGDTLHLTYAATDAILFDAAGARLPGATATLKDKADA
ncbi:MAG: TOBE domain-containing protein [Pseudomonadota bacterium]